MVAVRMAMIVGMPVRMGHGELSKTGDVERFWTPQHANYVIL